MTQATTPERVPQFDLADRMRKALREANIDVQDMAAYLGVSRTSVSSWINGRIRPSTQTQRLWALRCGVPYEWLSRGSTSQDSGVAGEPTGTYLQLVPELTSPYVAASDDDVDAAQLAGWAA